MLRTMPVGPPCNLPAPGSSACPCRQNGVVSVRAGQTLGAKRIIEMKRPFRGFISVGAVCQRLSADCFLRMVRFMLSLVCLAKRKRALRGRNLPRDSQAKGARKGVPGLWSARHASGLFCPLWTLLPCLQKSNPRWLGENGCFCSVQLVSIRGGRSGHPGRNHFSHPASQKRCDAAGGFISAQSPDTAV